MKLWFLTLILVPLASWSAPTASGPSHIQSLRKVLHEEEDSRTKYEGELRDLMDDIQNTDIANPNFETEISRSQNRLQDVKSKLQENQARIEFLNNFINAIDRNPSANVANTLLNISHIQVTSGVQSNTESKIWLFELYLSIAIKNYFEPSETLGAFVKAYMAYSSVLDPRSPKGFAKNRDYLSSKEEIKRNEVRTPSQSEPNKKQFFIH